MSSMRNAVQRRQHRERGQLQGREKWGILEKHKDYTLRAQDYNAKKTKIKRLQELASARNPDEFAFGMMAAESRVRGKHGAGARDSAAKRGLGHDAIKLLKTQDAGYLRTTAERVRREMEKVEGEVRLQEGMREVLGEGEKGGSEDGDSEEDYDDEFGGFDFGDEEGGSSGKKKKQSGNGRRKLVFADDQREQRVLKKRRLRENERDEAGDDTDGQEQGQKTAQRKTPKQLEAERQALVEARRARKMKKRAAEARENKLQALRKQFADLTAAERELDWQRGRMDNSVGGTNKHGIKWKIRERKK
ncbi:rRNA-processing protein UTP11 [Aspergillus clavatus NRRL 1]|uniref:U3 small nucleolar RNA-associated protein Utp11, putative n=1 Tax=Aspergillus clavatus (strain ATCC 1007 / CBS 513.65 / DSM 816 / NCTC 3887 / NRRL 1 / QM 1276 / 107) TaxID=344612 RepID=A1CP06_ASPCL|nr:U3 small nucleolar RNA-associated protein Utp11, putative [Aspergillus clavatus NRRL 1]EAW07377.1 U3 small nucleolar RNA-associated protein Utp11, putative [Aspergillus clavatus NRRL 1]